MFGHTIANRTPYPYVRETGWIPYIRTYKTQVELYTYACGRHYHSTPRGHIFKGSPPG